MAARDSREVSVIYKPILGHSFFRVGNDGSVWSQLRQGCRNSEIGDWHLLNWRPVKSGHVRVSIRNDYGFWIKTFAHVLVLEAFVGPRPTGMECLHCDGNPTNNRLTNLRWGTRKENVADARRHGTLAIGELNGNSKLKHDDILVIQSLLDAGFSQRKIADKFHVSQPTISAVAKGHRWNR